MRHGRIQEQPADPKPVHGERGEDRADRGADRPGEQQAAARLDEILAAHEVIGVRDAQRVLRIDGGAEQRGDGHERERRQIGERDVRADQQTALAGVPEQRQQAAGDRG